MSERAVLRTGRAQLRPERWRRLLGLATSVLLGAVLLAVVVEPEMGLALVAAALGALFLAMQPHWGILAIFVCMIFRISPVRIGPLGTAELVAAPLVLPLALTLLRDRGLWVWNVPQVRLLLGIGGVLLAATGWSLVMHPAPPLEELEAPEYVAFLFTQQVAFLIYFLYFIKTPRHLLYAVVVLLLVIIVAAVDGLFPLGGGARLDRIAASQGWVANPNRLAFACVWGTSLFWSLRFKGPEGWWRPLTLVPLLGLPITALMTGSRGGLLLLILLAALILREQRHWSQAQRVRAVVLVLVVALLALVAVPSTLLGRVQDFDVSGPTTIDRINNYRIAAIMLAENPLFGVGPGNFNWRNQMMTGVALSPHNSYIWALTSGGPLLLILYLAIFYRTHRMLAAVERSGPSQFEWLAAALRLNLIVLLAFSFFADMWLTTLLYLLLSLSIALARIAQGGIPPIATVPAPVALATSNSARP